MRHAAIVLLVAVLATAAHAEPDPVAAAKAAADAAFESGDHGRALELYEEVLAAVPDDTDALVRSGMLLSWDKRFDEAISRYDRALSIDSGHARAALERAKVLSWARQYDAAVASFRAILQGDPENWEARLGLARTLSWSGRQVEARAEYETILEKRPGDAEALLGVAQTYAWAGESEPARRVYGELLRATPGDKDATIGLAWLDLRDRDRRAAERRVRELESAHPGDSDVAALRRELDRASAPWIETGWDRIDDTDDTTLTTWRLEGGLGLPAGLDLKLGVARYVVETGPFDGSIDALYGVLGWTPRPRHRAEARIGVERLETSSGQRSNETTAGLAYGFPLSARWDGRLSWDRDPFRYNVPILDNRITGDLYAARVTGSFASAWRFDGGLGRWDLSDGNARNAVDAAVLRSWTISGHTLEAGYGARWLDWSEDLDNGYFDPSGFTAHLALGRARGPIRSLGYYDVATEAGVQSFTQSGRKVSGDPVVSAFALAGRRFGEALRLEGYAGTSTFAQQGGKNYRSRRVGARVRWTF